MRTEGCIKTKKKVTVVMAGTVCGKVALGVSSAVSL